MISDEDVNSMAELKIFLVISGKHWERAFIRALLREKGIYAIGCERKEEVRAWLNDASLKVHGFFLDISGTENWEEIYRMIKENAPDAGAVVLTSAFDEKVLSLDEKDVLLRRPVTVEEIAETVMERVFKIRGHS